MVIRAVLYDYDHTLVESPLDFNGMRQSVLRVCTMFGVTVEQPDGLLVLELIDAAAAQCDEAMACRLRGMAEQCVREAERVAARGTRVLDGVAASLARLRADGRAVGVITRNCREVVAPALAAHSLAHDLLLTRDDVPHVKPHPGHLLDALATLDVAPSQALLVGDFRDDMTCAKAAGLHAVGVTTGASNAEQLLAAGADTVLPSAAAVPAWLAGQGW